MKRQVFVWLAILGMLMIPGQVQAQEIKSQLSEATEFLNQALQDTKNPLLVSLIQQDLSRLKTGNLPADDGARREVEVPLMSHMKNSIAVPVTLEERVLATFIVDTGATYTVISPVLAQKLGVEITSSTPRMAILTANGTIQAPVVTLKYLRIGDVRVSNVQVIVQNLGNDPNFSGLLGMNFFKNLDFGFRRNKMVISVAQ